MSISKTYSNEPFDADLNIWHKISAMPWRESFRRHQVLFLGSVLYLLVSLSLILAFKPEVATSLVLNIFYFSASSTVFYLFVLAMFAAVTIYKTGFPDSPFSAIGQALRNDHLRPSNIPNIAFGWLSLILTIATFVNMKVMIPTLNPFAWDAAFAQWDQTLHFGTQPWEWLAPITHNYWVTKVLHFNYYMWFTIIYATYFWQVSTRQNPQLRLQFLMSFIGSWIIIGTGFATTLSSVGPIYIDRLLGAEFTAYKGATDYLEAMNAQSQMSMFTIKERLWEAYVGQPTDGFVRGISAMPSMHVAIALVLMLFGLRKGGWLAIASSMYFFTILIGSVALLWHYAVDGYVSIVLVLAIWWVSGKISRAAYPETKSIETE